MKTDDTYRTIAQPTRGVYKEKGSKFLAFAFPVTTEDAALTHVEKLRREYHDARHHCFAYVLGTQADRWRTNDDGEPSGTAGRPIYGQLLSLDLTNVLVTVVRYFGGVKLGVSGLTNAYKQATIDALKAATVLTCTIDNRYCLRFDYVALNDVMRVVKSMNLAVENQLCDNRCAIRLNVRRSRAHEFEQRVKALAPLAVELELMD